MFSEPNEEQALFDRARGGPLAKFSAQRGTELDFPKPVSNHALSRKSVSHHDSTKVGNTPIDEMLNFTGQGTGNEPFFQQQELPEDVGMISQIFSLPLIRCKVVESSGLGAYTAIPQPSSDIGTFSSRCWSTNMSSCSEPYVILQTSAKEYARRQLVDKASHIRNIDAHVIFVESSSFPSPSTPCIVSIMCSNHPKSGFVPVASRSVDALSATFRIPGTAMCPFIKLRIKPLSPSVKLVRIQAVALTLSASWTEEVANDNLETQSSVELRDVTNILTSNLSKIPGSCEREEAIGLLGRSSHQRIKFPQQDCHFGVSIDEGRTHESLDSDASRSPNNSHGTPAFNWYSGETETLSRKVNDFFSICEQMILRQQSYNDVETTWSNIPLWTHREALHFGMSRAVAISASICYNTRESLCSCLTQPFGFSILSVLSQKAASEQNLLATHFDTMSCISHFIGANGLHIELAFRVSNGFCCAICPNVPLCAYNARVEKKWLLVLQGDKKEEITDIIKLASDVFREGLPQGGCQLRSHGALSIILDLTNSFCELMASMHQWVCINALHYYGSEDQYPLRYLRTSGSLSNVTNWGGFSLCGRRMPSNIVESEEIGRHYSLLHLQLRLHTPAFFVWESRQRLSPRVILTDVHISEALPMVDGAMVPDTVLGLCSGLSRNMNQSSMIVGKMIVATDQPWRDLLKCANTLEDREKVCEADYSTLLEKSRRVTSTFTLHALGTAFRQEWTTIAISLPEDLLPFKVKIKGEEFSLLDEDVFMDTLSRWPYAYPKNVVVFVMSDTSDVGHSVAVSRSLEPRLSPLFSTNALRAFSRARNLRDSLSFH